MKTGHIHRVVAEADVRALRKMLDPSAVRREPDGRQDDGLRAVLDHTLRVSSSHQCWARGDDYEEYNPTSLRSVEGEHIWLHSLYVPAAFDRHEFLGWVLERDVSVGVPRTALPWAKGLLRHQPGLPIVSGDVRHIADDHPDRWAGVGLQPHQIRPRLAARIRDMEAALAGDPGLAAAYWHHKTDCACLVAPLLLDGLASVLAAVLLPQLDRYELRTILPLHDAYWNVVAVGAVPPAWMNGTAPTDRAA
ncbi:MAG TPA: hypothetical protein VFJ97_04455 [Dermatophilaceae bacterium]|nr:hypothetical protein [Dermatophilaceae bacterium]